MMRICAKERCEGTGKFAEKKLTLDNNLFLVNIFTKSFIIKLLQTEQK